MVKVERVAVLPPSQYLGPCPVQYADYQIQTVIEALTRAIECERADKVALRAWADALAPEE